MIMNIIALIGIITIWREAENDIFFLSFPFTIFICLCNLITIYYAILGSWKNHMLITNILVLFLNLFVFYTIFYIL